MAIIALKAWYLEQYQPIREVVKRPHDLRLSRNSLLKSGLRADFLDDSQTLQESPWFQRYLEGERVEFYIEGSGGYLIANIDLISHEIYFTKQEITAWLEPVIFCSCQEGDLSASEALSAVLEETLTKFNQRSRLSLALQKSHPSQDIPRRLSDTQLRAIETSLLFIADVTPIATIESGDRAQFVLDPNVCVELGYALRSKRPGQVFLVYQERSDLKGKFPFDLSQHQKLGFKDRADLSNTLPSILETLLQRFHLL